MIKILYIIHLYNNRGLKNNQSYKILKNSVKLAVDTPKGKATLVEVYVTELGHLMAKIYYSKEKIWVNHRIGNLEDLARTANIELLTPISKKMNVTKEVV